MGGPLSGTRILEVGGIGPGPFAAMMLADLGADVIRLDRPGGGVDTAHRILFRGRRSVAIDLKHQQGQELARRLAESCDGLVEGFRPGVMERLGLGPDELLARNPRLVYGRMTGWGQDGPWARTAGHDINYIAVAGALEPIAGAGLAPTPPLNLLGDFGAGGMLLACGLLAGLVHARATGEGQVVDAAIVDGSALLTAMLHSMRAAGTWSQPRGQNLLDGGAPFYRTYATADGRWLAVGAIEPQFYARLLDGLGLREELAGVDQYDAGCWPRVQARIAGRIAERGRDEWMGVFAGTDACVSEVVAPAEVLSHPHLAARQTFSTADGLLQPSPAPRFSGTPLPSPQRAPAPGADTVAVLTELGLDGTRIRDLLAAGVVQPPAGPAGEPVPTPEGG